MLQSRAVKLHLILECIIAMVTAKLYLLSQILSEFTQKKSLFFNLCKFRKNTLLFSGRKLLHLFFVKQTNTFFFIKSTKIKIIILGYETVFM